MIRYFYIVIIITSILGCAQQKQLTRDEQLALHNRKLESCSKLYKKFTKEELLLAIEKVLTLIDPSDVTFIHKENGLMMSRKYTFYLILVAVWGTDYWLIQTIPENNGVRVTLRGTTVQKQALGPSSGSVPQKLDYPIDSSIFSEAECRVFFKRLDYMLGLEDKWLDCNKAKLFAKQIGIKDTFMFMCGDNWFGVNSKNPDYYNKEK